MAVVLLIWRWAGVMLVWEKGRVCLLVGWLLNVPVTG